jgi:hypothetical protein
MNITIQTTNDGLARLTIQTSMPGQPINLGTYNRLGVMRVAQELEYICDHLMDHAQTMPEVKD